MIPGRTWRGGTTKSSGACSLRYRGTDTLPFSAALKPPQQNHSSCQIPHAMTKKKNRKADKFTKRQKKSHCLEKKKTNKKTKKK